MQPSAGRFLDPDRWTNRNSRRLRCPSVLLLYLKQKAMTKMPDSGRKVCRWLATGPWLLAPTSAGQRLAAQPGSSPSTPCVNLRSDGGCWASGSLPSPASDMRWANPWLRSGRSQTSRPGRFAPRRYFARQPQTVWIAPGRNSSVRRFRTNNFSRQLPVCPARRRDERPLPVRGPHRLLVFP